MPINPAFRHPGVLLTTAALIGTTGVSMFSLARERQNVKALDANRKQVLAELAQTRSQIRDISARLDSVKTAVSSQRTLPAQTPSRRARLARAQSSRSQSEDVRLQSLQSQISQQQEKLAQTREEIVKTQQYLQGEVNSARVDLQGKLNSTKDELGGAIAKNHDELATLKKRGERNYYEFELVKSKEVRRVGPVSLALRKSNTKHKNYNMDMLVEDNRLEKKNVNLYEPVWINLTDRPQPVEIIVNFIGKDQVRGYVSEPKYKRSELAESAPSPVSRPTQLTTR